MKNKILLVIVVILSFVLLGVIKLKKDTNHSFLSEEKSIKIKNEENEIKELKLEDYLVGVLAAEMPASFNIEALKAQAVASRTYALYKIKHSNNKDYDVLTTVTDQSFITEEEMKNKWQTNYDKYINKIKQAIQETENEVMYYNNEIIESFYFAMSNGKTESAQAVFQEELPYIESVNSSWDNESLNKFLVTIEFSLPEFCEKLALKTCNNIVIDKIEKNESNRVVSLIINNEKFLGTDIRKKLNLRSTDFDIQINDNITITTKGYGHGVGMSQYGANGMANEGFNYKEILNYYYKGITIKKMV